MLFVEFRRKQINTFVHKFRRTPPQKNKKQKQNNNNRQTNKILKIKTSASFSCGRKLENDENWAIYGKKI